MRTSLIDAVIAGITARLLRASLALIIRAFLAFALFVGWRIVGFILSPPASWETPGVTGLVEAFNEPNAPWQTSRSSWWTLAARSTRP